jgi:hypothetical protein
MIRFFTLLVRLSVAAGAQSTAALERHGAVSTIGNPESPELPLINRLDELVGLRFTRPVAGELGMSRITRPSSMGKQFEPNRANESDFMAENSMEREIIGKLEERGLQVGLYMFGPSIIKAMPQFMDYRALKGPATITRTTPRPGWYPLQPIDPRIHAREAKIPPSPTDSLPDWKVIYPLARNAMLRFQEGGAGFETKLESWDIAARPVLAERRCAACHDVTRPIGGVLYAFRRSRH